MPRNDKHVRVQLNAVSHEFGLVRGVDVASREHPKSRHCEFHDPAGRELGDNLPAQPADDVHLVRRVSHERDVRRRRPAGDASGRIGCEASTDLYCAHGSRM